LGGFASEPISRLPGSPSAWRDMEGRATVVVLGPTFIQATARRRRSKDIFVGSSKKRRIRVLTPNTTQMRLVSGQLDSNDQNAPTLVRSTRSLEIPHAGEWKGGRSRGAGLHRQPRIEERLGGQEGDHAGVLEGNRRQKLKGGKSRASEKSRLRIGPYRGQTVSEGVVDRRSRS